MLIRKQPAQYSADQLVNIIYVDAILAMALCGYPVLFIGQHWKFVTDAITVYAVVGIIVFAVLFAIGFIRHIIDIAGKIRKMEATETP